MKVPGHELEDLVVLQPEMGGSRSLLAYFSSGVLVARSDRTSVRFGHGLPEGDLQWLRSKTLDVLRPRERRAAPRAAAPVAARIPSARLPHPGIAPLLLAGVLALTLAALWPAPPCGLPMPAIPLLAALESGVAEGAVWGLFAALRWVLPRPLA